MNGTAFFSPDRRYRYRLDRWWGKHGRALVFICLNPSTANESQDDPTVRRCIAFGQAWGYDGVQLFNLYALVSTDPNRLLTETDSIGPETDRYLTIASVLSHKVVAAWGNCGARDPQRVGAVLNIFTNCQHVYCFRQTKLGQPNHPLYVQMVPEYSLSLYSPFRGKLIEHTR